VNTLTAQSYQASSLGLASIT